MAQEEVKREIPRAGLAQTLEDHIAMHSTPTDALRLNPGKTLFEILGAEGVRERMINGLKIVREMHVDAVKGDERDRRFFRVVFDMLFDDIEYLRRIKQLPLELKNVRRKDFALPRKSKR